MIRIPDVPQLPTEDGYRVPRVNPDIAAAPGKALGAVASAIGGVGEAFQKIGEQAQEQVNQTTILNRTGDWNKQLADFEVERSKETDPAKQVAMTSDFISNLKNTSVDPSDAPAVASALQDRFTNFAERAYIQGKVTAATTARTQLEEATNYKLKNAQNIGDVQEAHAAAKAGGVASDQELPQWEQAFNEKQGWEQRQVQAETSGYQYMQDNPEEPPPGTKDPLKYIQIWKQAKQSYSEQVAQTTKDAQDQIAAGNITTPQQLDAYVGEHNVSPSVKDRLGDYMNSIAKDRNQQQANDPAFQAQITGDVSARIATYSIDQPGFDEAYVGIKNDIVRLPQGPLREELTQNLEDARTGQKAQVKSNISEALKDMDNAYQVGAFYGAPVKTSLAEIKNSGFISRDNMVPAGFDDMQIKTVEAVAKDPKMIAKGQAAILRKQEELVREYYPNRPFAQDDSLMTDAQKQVFEAIAGNRGDSYRVDWRSPQQQVEGRSQYGQARLNLMNWARLNPDDAKDPAKVEAARYKAVAPFGKAKASSALIDTPPLPLEEPMVLPPKPEK